MPDFRYFQIPQPPHGHEYYRVDEHADPGRQVCKLVDGLWTPVLTVTAEQFFIQYGLWQTEISATDVPCPMCDVVADRVTRVVVHEWPDALAIKPLPDGLVEGHTLVIPRVHLVDAAESPLIAGMVAARAAEFGALMFGSNFQLVNDVGPLADQTVFHLHWHVWPRRRGDGLVMPWTAQQQDTAAAAKTAGAECTGDERRPWARSAAEQHPERSAGTDGETALADKGAGSLGPQHTSAGAGVPSRPPAPAEPPASERDCPARTGVETPLRGPGGSLGRSVVVGRLGHPAGADMTLPMSTAPAGTDQVGVSVHANGY